MKNNFKTCYIGDICKINENTYSNSDKWNFVNYLDTGNITKNKIENIQFINLSLEKLPSRAKRKVKNNNIIYSTVRPNQKHFGIIEEQPENFLVSTGFAVLDVDCQKANPRFVYYYLTQENYTNALHAIAEQSTSAYPSIKPSDIGNRKIILPTLEVQNKIAKVLSALDNKIELNNSINNNLEQQAQAIYENYVMKYKNNIYQVGNISLTANTGADAIQKAPIVDFDTGIKCIRVGDMSNNRDIWSWGYTQVTNEVYKQYQLKRNDILVTRTATLGLNRLVTEDLQAVYNNGLIRLSIDSSKMLPLLLYRQFQTKDFRNYISRIESETSVRPNMKINYLLNYQFDCISITEQLKLEKILLPIIKKQDNLSKENNNLTQLRDALLPKLMSGEIDVENVDISDLSSADKLSFNDEVNL